MSAYLVLANSLPVAGGWMLAWMVLVALVLLPFYPLILRHRRRAAQEKAHERVEQARVAILADGKVEGPKGPYVPHEPWNIGGTGRTPSQGPPRANAYHGTVWP